MSRRQELRKYIICVSAAADMLRQLQQADYVRGQRTKTLKAGIASMDKLLEALTAICDKRQIEAIVRYCQNSELCVIPKEQAKRDGHLAIVPSDLLAELALNTECNFCMKEGANLRKCKLKKLLERCGIFGTVDNGDCPYKVF